MGNPAVRLLVRRGSCFGGYTSDLNPNCLTYLEKLSEQKFFRKLVRRASACSRMFLGCARSNSIVRICLRSVNFMRVHAQCCQQTNSCVFSACSFVCALSNSLVLAHSAPDVLIPNLILNNDTRVILRNFQRAFVYAQSNSFVLALSSWCIDSYLIWVLIPAWFEQWRTCSRRFCFSGRTETTTNATDATDATAATYLRNGHEILSDAIAR